jgi:signal transduction histidine kinase
MRDPLRNVSVRYKLAFTFLVVCFLAFGVGGTLVSLSARDTLESEILSGLRVRSRYYSQALAGDLRALGLRARDFASDGYIRTRFEELEAGHAEVAGDLRRHLVENKLPLEPAFVNLAVASGAGTQAFVALEGEAWTADLPAAAFGEDDWISGLVRNDDPEVSPSLVLTTPLTSQAGDRRIGTLLVEVRSGAWIAGSLGTITEGIEPGPGFGLFLLDGQGGALEIPAAFLDQPGAALSGPGLRVRDAREATDAVAGGRGVLAQSIPLGLDGWSLEVSLRTQDAMASVSGLQARFLFVGVVLATVACLMLLFPMRFLARPISQLRDAAMHIRGGDFGARVPVESADEIGELSRSFNLMAEAIEERAAKLEEAARSLEARKNELRKERDRLNTVILSMRDGLMVLDAEGRPEVWNAAAEPLKAIVEHRGLDLSSHRNCARASGEGLDTLVGPEAPVEGRDAGRVNPCLTCLFEPSAPPRSCLVDAGPYVFEIHSTKLAPRADGRSGRVLVARDVTDRVAEDERQIHQERLAVLGEVAAVMAHELNNPLAAISMFTQMIASGLPDDSPLREDVSVIERNVETCTRTIRELLDYATGATPEVGPVDVHASLREVASFLRAFREREETELVLELEAEDAIVTGDEVQLRQVFVNLVLNALQAVGQGRVTVRTHVEEGHVVVDVVDDGPGIPTDVGETVFKPFYTTKPRGSGTGLGLSTARRITEIQGGGLELVDGSPGRTTFRVRLLRGTA